MAIFQEGYSQYQGMIDSIHVLIANNPKDVFIICRGTQGKRNCISKVFNYTDSNISHVGLGIYIGNQLRVYSVEDINHGVSALKCYSLEQFLYPADLFYCSIWFASSSRIEWRRIKRYCKQYFKRKIGFDYQFTLGNGDFLYCSEFCAEILNKAFVGKLEFKPCHILLNGLYEALLGRKNLTYYPVDFFQQSGFFRCIYERRLN